MEQYLCPSVIMAVLVVQGHIYNNIMFGMNNEPLEQKTGDEKRQGTRYKLIGLLDTSSEVGLIFLLAVMYMFRQKHK